MKKPNSSDLRKRLADLRISEPFRLSKPVQNSQNEVPHDEAPRNTTLQTEVPQIEEPRSEQPSLETAHERVPQNELPPNREDQQKQAQSELPHIEKAPTKASQKGAPRIEGVGDIGQGFFKLSHAIFAHGKLRKMSGDCFRLFLWLSSRAWRYPDSDGTLRASVTYMESHIGMGHATISRGLKTLKDEGLVSLEEVNFKRGNLWRVSPIAVGSFDPETAPPPSKVLCCPGSFDRSEARI